MATLSKTVATELLAIQQLASNGVGKSSAVDVSTKFAATIFVHLGRDDVGGALTEGVKLRVEASAKGSADDHWYPIAQVDSGISTPEAEAVSGTEGAGSDVIEVASTTNLIKGDLILFKNTTLSNSEFSRIVNVVTNTSITIMDALTRAQTGSTIYDQAEFHAFSIDCTALSRIRFVADNSNGGRTVIVEAFMTTADAIA